MKIAVHTSHFPYDTNVEGYVSGGGERVAYQVSKGLADRGHEVNVYTASSDGHEISRQSNLQVTRYRSIGRIGKTSIAPKQFVPSSESADVVHVHNTTPPGVISGILHATRIEAPIVLTHHGNDRFVSAGSPIKKALDYIYAEVLLDYILDRVDKITIPSMSYIEDSNRLSQYKSKIVEIPNGVAVEKMYAPRTAPSANKSFNLNPDLPVIFFIGDMIEKKGVDLLVEAANKLGGEAQFVLAGNGPLLNKIKGQEKENIYVPGYVSEDEKIALFNRADIFCLPSRTRTEVFPLVVLEAYASRTPVIASDLSTFDQFITDGVGGFRFESDDVGSLSNTINRALSDPERLSVIAENALQIAEDHEWRNIIESYESAFQSVM